MTKSSIATFLPVCLFCVLILVAGAAAQEVPTIIQVNVENWVNYAYDVADFSKLARSSGSVASAAPVNFAMWVSVMDVTAVNGSPAKGVMVAYTQGVSLTPNPNPGQAIADLARNAYQRMCFEFLKPDGGLIGNIYALGLNGGVPPPGSPAGVVAANFAIIGGTGAFVGARGTASPFPVQSPRSASQAEDPSMRRINGGGKGGFFLQIWPMFRPEIVVTQSGPVVLHSDWSSVTADKPAKKGETLMVYAKGLGRTHSGCESRRPLPERTALTCQFAGRGPGGRESFGGDQSSGGSGNHRHLPGRFPST